MKNYLSNIDGITSSDIQFRRSTNKIMFKVNYYFYKFDEMQLPEWVNNEVRNTEIVNNLLNLDPFNYSLDEYKLGSFIYEKVKGVVGERNIESIEISTNKFNDFMQLKIKFYIWC